MEFPITGLESRVHEVDGCGMHRGFRHKPQSTFAENHHLDLTLNSDWKDSHLCMEGSVVSAPRTAEH
jgi:hypothetical protein